MTRVQMAPPAAASRTAQQHDVVRAGRCSSTAHLLQPYEGPRIRGHHHACMHVVQHAAHAHAHAYGTRELSFPRPVPRFPS